jgi:hypothetical protein
MAPEIMMMIMVWFTWKKEKFDVEFGCGGDDEAYLCFFFGSSFFLMLLLHRPGLLLGLLWHLLDQTMRPGRPVALVVHEGRWTLFGVESVHLVVEEMRV